MEQLKVGIIGMGKMGLLHAGIFNTLQNSKLSAISDNKKMIIGALGKYLHEVKVFHDYKNMLEKENLDIIVITTPVFFHKEMISETMKYHLNIFVEKPFVMNNDESKSILKKPYDKTTMVGYCRRFMVTYNMVKNIIDKSMLGEVHFFNSYLYVTQVLKQGKGWLYDPNKSGGGVLMDLGSHAIDLLHYLFGDMQTIHAFSKQIYNQEVEDYVSINMEFKNNSMGSLQLCWSIRNYRLPEFKIEIHFDNGKIIATEKYINIYSEINCDFIKKGWNTFYKQNLQKNVPINLGGPEYTLEDMHFLDCIINNKKCKSSFNDAAKTNFAIDKVYSSINNKKTEKIIYEVENWN